MKSENRKPKGEKMSHAKVARDAKVKTVQETLSSGKGGAGVLVVETRVGKVFVAVAQGERSARVWLGLSGRWLEPLRTRKFTVGPNGEGLEWSGKTETVDHRP